jgi:hypothetical protein
MVVPMQPFQSRGVRVCEAAVCHRPRHAILWLASLSFVHPSTYGSKGTRRTAGPVMRRTPYVPWHVVKWCHQNSVIT